MKRILLIAIFSVCILTSCEKENEVVPAKDISETIMTGGTNKKLEPNDGGW